MTLHPWHLHATAALWSLAAAWPLLLAAQQHARAAYADDHGYVQAWRPTIGRGGSSEPDDALANALTGRSDYTLRKLDEIHERGMWSIQQARWLLLSAGADVPRSWAQFAGALATADGRTARDITGWLAPADHVVRRALSLTPDLWMLPDNPACPSCSVRLLRAHTAAPSSADWTVVCTAGCRCRGDGCPCGMLVREQGVPHIWLGRPKEAL